MLRYKIWRQVRFEKILLCDEAIVSTNSTRKAIVRNNISSENFIEAKKFLISRRIAYSDNLFRIFKSVTVRSCPRAVSAIRHKNDRANANIIPSVGISSVFEVMKGMQAMEMALKVEVKAAIREVIAVIWEVSAAIWGVEDATWEVEAAIGEVDFSILVKVFLVWGSIFLLVFDEWVAVLGGDASIWRTERKDVRTTQSEPRILGVSVWAYSDSDFWETYGEVRKENPSNCMKSIRQVAMLHSKWLNSSTSTYDCHPKNSSCSHVRVAWSMKRFVKSEWNFRNWDWNLSQCN